MRFEQSTKQSLTQKIDPKLIMANSILQLSSMELQQVIEQELAENPALEESANDPCENCEHPKSFCIDCPFKIDKTITSENDDLNIYEIEQPIDFAADRDSEDTDIISNVCSEITLHEYLYSLLRTVLPQEKWNLGEIIISNIKDSGYLETSIEEIAYEANKSIESVEEVLFVIQTFDPPGIGARDLRECCILQLERLNEDDKGNLIAQEIVKNYWGEFLADKLGKIARMLHVNISKVIESVEFIKKQLNPYPGNSFHPPFQNDQRSSKASVMPDVIVTKTPNGFEVQITGYDQHLPYINPRYLAIYKDIKCNDIKYTNEDKQHITEFVSRAEMFLKNINERRKTLKKITLSIIEYQEGYLQTESNAFLRPLTRTKIAKFLDMHESTISRATVNKYIQLPNEMVVPFDFFFDCAASVKDMVKYLIDSEDKNNPLSDQKIADILNEQGFNLARRTVVKYREALKILSSRYRKK